METTILVFTVPGVTATGSLVYALTQAMDLFDCGNAPVVIRRITIDDIQNGILTPQATPRLFILPGILSEDSPYQHVFKKDHTEKLAHFVESGNVFLGICAGACFVSETTKFVPPWQGGVKNLRSLHPLFNGTANGPLHHYAVRQGLNLAPVRLAGHQPENIFLPYSMGPALIPANPHDPDLEILATYEQTPIKSIAVLRQKFGAGAAYLSGPHPEIGYHPVSQDYPGPSLDRIRETMTRLKPHEADRKRFWNYLVDRIRQDLTPCR